MKSSPEQDSTEQQEGAPGESSAPKTGELSTTWTLSVIYGAFYFCRTNLAAALPGLEASAANGGLGLDGPTKGSILGSLKLTYGIGQLINGQLAEHISPRKLLAIGMLGSAALNIAFGFGTSAVFLMWIWAANGYFQSLGWTPCMRVVGNWIPVDRRGKTIGIIGLGYQISAAATFWVSGFAAEHYGWRAALYLPAGILTASAIFMLLFLRDAPSEPLPIVAAVRHLPHAEAPRRFSFLQILVATLSNPYLWILGVSLGLLNACRYGFVDWGISHLVEVQKTGIGKAGLQYGVLAIGAVPGVFLAGWATDRFFGGRRIPVICGLLLLLAALTVLYGRSVGGNSAITIVTLIGIGFCLFGPQVLLVGTAPTDLARLGTAAAAAGFVDFLGYVGAAVGDRVTGAYKDASGWETVIHIWAGCAAAAAVTAALLWNVRPSKNYDIAESK